MSVTKPAKLYVLLLPEPGLEERLAIAAFQGVPETVLPKITTNDVEFVTPAEHARR